MTHAPAATSVALATALLANVDASPHEHLDHTEGRAALSVLQQRFARALDRTAVGEPGARLPRTDFAIDDVLENQLRDAGANSVAIITTNNRAANAAAAAVCAQVRAQCA